MSSLSTTLGLRALSQGSPPVPNLASAFLIWNLVFAYPILTPRAVKRFYFKIDHNVSPREDIASYGDAMVKEGKMSGRQLAILKRWDAAHTNAIEGFAPFVGGVLLALHAGVPTQTLNGLMALYSVMRVGCAIAYITIENEKLSFLRSVLWWTGYLSCVAMMVLAGKRL